MGILQAVKLALASIVANKMRSFLTMLGIIIGVAAVIILVSLGQGTTQQVTGQIQGMGSNLITINIRSNQTDISLTYDEIMGWKSRTGIKGIAPVITGSVNVKYGNKKYDTSLEGVNSEYEQVRAYQVQEGRFILPEDLSYRQKVVLLGTDVWKQLFNSSDPVGETVKINGENFKVVGLLASKGTASMGSNDDKVMIPITTAQRLLETRGITSAYIQASSSDQVDSVVAQLEAILLRKLKNSDYFNVFNQAEMLSTISSVTGTLTAMLGGIAAISLLVGGIGIMNIMLVSVTERTREIGIRKAIGAKRRDILRQFLIEALVVSSSGGIIGIMLGVGGARLISSLMSMQTAISLNIVLIAFGFAVAIGVIFGIYPANKAAKLNPIEALRFE